jgi:hypothetical protein
MLLNNKKKLFKNTLNYYFKELVHRYIRIFECIVEIALKVSLYR